MAPDLAPSHKELTLCRRGRNRTTSHYWHFRQCT